jgi:hypothetical protein
MKIRVKTNNNTCNNNNNTNDNNNINNNISYSTFFHKFIFRALLLLVYMFECFSPITYVRSNWRFDLYFQPLNMFQMSKTCYCSVVDKFCMHMCVFDFFQQFCELICSIIVYRHDVMICHVSFIWKMIEKTVLLHNAPIHFKNAFLEINYRPFQPNRSLSRSAECTTWILTVRWIYYSRGG